jgi:hypothetical protein
MDKESALSTPLSKDTASSVTGPIFKGLLQNKEGLVLNGQGGADPGLVARIVRDALDQSALAIPIGEANAQEMEIALKLANIMKNPTEDQKFILATVETLLKDVKNMEDQTGSPELKKASDDLLQMVASVLIAQAIPDLLKEGDVASIKNIFSGLNDSKIKILQDYQESTRPYYDEIVKDLSNNMSLLQLKNVLSGSMTKEELEKLPRSDIDKILEKLRQAKDKSSQAQYILQQEEKYRSKYLDPNKKLLEEHMKDMMKSFTQKLSKVLESTGTKKK